MLQIQTKQVEPDITVLEMAGKITIGRDCKQLEWITDNLIKENQKKVIFDLTGVTMVDSTGIGILVMSAGLLKNAGGSLRVVCSGGHVEQVLKMTNVDKVIDIHPTAVAAAAGF
jgi:anti-sigma B factor antagonist